MFTPRALFLVPLTIPFPPKTCTFLLHSMEVVKVKKWDLTFSDFDSTVKENPEASFGDQELDYLYTARAKPPEYRPRVLRAGNRARRECA